MCGIIGYIGSKEASPIVMEGLKRMEYRGYDSAGLAVVQGDSIQSAKKSGKLDNLKNELHKYDLGGTVGIGHIRWATHGGPTDANAHPHHDSKQEIFLNHNGIIENYNELKKQLIEQGHEFYSETDTEVLAHLIEIYYGENVPLEEAVISALNDVVGTYGITVVSSREPEKLVAARLGSPLILGIVDDGEYIVASDVSAIMAHTREVVYLNDAEICILTKEGFTIKDLTAQDVDHDTHHVDWDVSKAQKMGYEHFMLKEMFDQPNVVLDCLRGRLNDEDGMAIMRGFIEHEDRLKEINRIIILGMGTALYAGMVGEYMIEEYAGIPVDVESAAEFRYRKPIIDEHTAVIAVSQSGETADTLAAIREAKLKGALVLGVVNVVGSTIAREVDGGAYSHAGPEIGVASTKAFISQLTVFALIALFLGRHRGLSVVMGQRIAKELLEIPEKIQKILDQKDSIEAIAKKYAKYRDFFFLGRKYQFPIALEGALKLKEISYIHAEGYGAGDMKHGPIALIDENFPCMVLAPKDSVYDKTFSNMQEVKARGAKVIAVTTEDNTDLAEHVNDIIYVPKTLEMLMPLLTVIPMQIFSYYVAKELDRDIDQPRNLAKSVTVE